MSDHHANPSYDEITEAIRLAEVDLGRPQNAYDHEESLSVQGQSHPEANFDGFSPPEDADWDEVFSDNDMDMVSIGAAPSYEPDEEEKLGAADDIDLSHLGDPSYEGAPPKQEHEAEPPDCLDPRFRFRAWVEKWPHLAAVYYAIMMAIDSKDAEPIGEADHGLKTLRCPEGSNQWYVSDVLKGNLFVQHDPSMNHPLSAAVKGGSYVVWVYKQGRKQDFPGEPIGYIQDGYVFRRKKE